jgi:hypothetical protein
MDEDDLFAQLENEIGPVDTSNDIDVTQLNIAELIDFRTYIENLLFGQKQALNPTRQDSRDLHSLLVAVKVEIARKTS